MFKRKTTGYEPLYTLKNVATDIWIADGGWISFYGVPFPTRMTVVRLANGDIWMHSPIADREGLSEAVAALGPVRHLIAPNWIHYAWVSPWQDRFQDAATWVSPGVVDRAKGKGVPLIFDHELGNKAPLEWASEISQRVADSGIHREVVFFHHASRTLILTDLIENFELTKMPWWTRPLLKLGGVCDPDGRMPRDMAATFQRRPEHIRSVVDTMLAWDPERVILAHGRWYTENGTEELRRAFRRFLTKPTP
ncbi:DUF4336 domain-containing protein [Marinimicrobium sp. ABcell2]|uniref:DUF4336 domain-containing protein n=1 Tax=Marinimicrobium sp. ABcell2 TaxID=3069751 RepID=UPI0027B70566|nr:DUF4336 domain-containing protein [Marinimicrobium sp. ABcell2]MDQ2075906.1 DUF4336 domain-containing protein [Marinimicrobium sp. ABcell2]